MKVPHKNKDAVRSLCRRLVPGGRPVEVLHQPLAGKPLCECFTIVPEHVAAHGGKQTVGWAIWQWRKVMIEAEFHAVWQREDGTRIDLTPRPKPFNHILFLVDRRRQYEGRRVDNVRQALSGDPVIRDWILLAERFAELIDKGDVSKDPHRVSVNSAVMEVAYAMEQLKAILIDRYGEP